MFLTDCIFILLFIVSLISTQVFNEIIFLSINFLFLNSKSACTITKELLPTRLERAKNKERKALTD